MNYIQIIYRNFFIKLIIFSFLINHCNCSVNVTIGSCIVQYHSVCSSEFVKFYISSSDRPNLPPILLDDRKPKLPKWINLKNDMKLIIHGYAGGIEYNQTKEIRNEYLKRKNTNVITVDWGKLALLPCYPSAAVNTRHAGECIAKFLLNLGRNNTKINSTNIHIIGFSLGAHVAAFASNALEKEIGLKVQRITGLDPALPFFATSSLNLKLDSSDADFVDVIHTSIGIFGKIEPSGHVDFYMNNGQFQPNCNGSKNIPLCSHMMANIFFAESINSDVGFWGIQCSSYFQYIFGSCGDTTRILNSQDEILMGENCVKTSNGIVYVLTNSKPPYALGRNANI